MKHDDLIARLRERADLTPASHAVLLWEAADALSMEWADANHPAVEALARVRELHYRVTTCHLGDDAYCHHDGLAWPCMTIMATEVEA